MSGKMTRADEMSCFSSAFRSVILFATSEACRGESLASPYANKITAWRKAGTSAKKQNLARKARSPAASICNGRVQPTGKAYTDTIFPRADRTAARLGGFAQASESPFDRESPRSPRSDTTVLRASADRRGRQARARHLALAFSMLVNKRVFLERARRNRLVMES